jgi:hypothetical protein
MPETKKKKVPLVKTKKKVKKVAPASSRNKPVRKKTRTTAKPKKKKRGLTTAQKVGIGVGAWAATSILISAISVYQLSKNKVIEKLAHNDKIKLWNTTNIMINELTNELSEREQREQEVSKKDLTELRDMYKKAVVIGQVLINADTLVGDEKKETEAFVAKSRVNIRELNSLMSTRSHASAPAR